jgi:Fic family protein
MARNSKLPKNEKELKEREAAGLWRAQALARKIGESNEKITLAVILHIHKVFLEDVAPDISGRFRKPGEDIKKLKFIEPPLGSVVQKRMYQFWDEFSVRFSKIPSKPRGSSKSYKKALGQYNEAVIDLAAWTQYQIAAIHPFCEGNGRMARMMTNLILYHFNLQPTDIRYEGENRIMYLDALGAIDRDGDYRQLKELIARGVIQSYKRLVDARKKARNK